MTVTHFQLTELIAGEFARFPQVAAIALGGSMGGSQETDNASDIDVYVYTRAEIPLEIRRSIMEKTGGASRANIGLNYWGPGDEWYHLPSGIEVDMVYFDTAWMSEQLEQVIYQHRASMGYTTCFWNTFLNSKVLFDPDGWYSAARQKVDTAYPEELRQAIVALNHPVLRGIIPAYAHQIEKAVNRADLVSVNHRLAALLASYFDILFAVNRQLHPGEKRLVQKTLQKCARLPQNFEGDLSAIFAVSPANLVEMNYCVSQLLDHLDEWLSKEGFLLDQYE